LDFTKLLVAKFFTYVLHPLFMPTYGLIILFNVPSYISLAISAKLKLYITIIMFCGTFLMPFLASLVLLSQGYLTSLTIGTRQQRNGPYILSIVSYACTYYLLRRLQLPNSLLFMLLGITISVILVFLINLKWKVSAHMVGIGGILGAMITFSIHYRIDLLMVILITLFFAGILGSCRLILKAHNPQQVYTGFFLGLFIQLALLLV
jgi:hypothetical protein